MKKPIEFINYEGLQVRYNQEELVVIPLEITRSKNGESGDGYLQTYWKIGKKTELVQPYYVNWKHLDDCIEVKYEKSKNKLMEQCAKKHGEEISYGIEKYVLKEGRVIQILWYAFYDKGEITYNSKDIKHKKKLDFKTAYQKKRNSHLVEQIEREQKAFRRNLFDLDRKCAISKTSLKTVLEAAHVRAVKDGGFETVDNGILLRADLHLLFDNGLLKINNKGVVRISPKAKEYKKYNGVKINRKILERVKNNLEITNKVCKKK